MTHMRSFDPCWPLLMWRCGDCQALPRQGDWLPIRHQGQTYELMVWATASVAELPVATLISALLSTFVCFECGERSWIELMEIWLRCRIELNAVHELISMF